MSRHFRTVPTAMAALAVAAIAAFSVPPAQAFFSLGDASSFAVYGSGSTTTDQLYPGPLTVNGNVGVGLNADSKLGGVDVVIKGQILYASNTIDASKWDASGGPISIYGQDFVLMGDENQEIAAGVTKGQLVAGSSEALKAAGDLATLYAFAKAQSATSGSPSGDMAGSNLDVHLNGSTNANDNYVVNLHKLILDNTDKLTLHGNANSYFIFNIENDFQVKGSARIILDGVDPDHVLFNMLKSADGGDAGKNVDVGGAAIGVGAILALDRGVNFNHDAGSTSTWNGRVFGDDSGKTIQFGSNAIINQPGFVGPAAATPEPPSVVLLLIAMLAGLGIHRFRSPAGRPARVRPSFVPA
jgi:hypothetical protein